MAMDQTGLREMYNMGERLCQLAQDMGYTPGEGEEKEYEASEAPTEAPPMKSGKSNVDIAIGFLK